MQTKHFFDDPMHLVNTALQSLTITNPSLAFDRQKKIVYRRQPSTTTPKVSIVSGGGSGHEPGMAGFVGRGLLTASVAGTIFASPSAEQVRRALLTHVPTEKGVLVLIMNYTGDVLNFGIAAEKLKASGVATEFFAIGDDVSVGRAKAGKVGRRGIAGSILVLKICGALAELGGSLTDVYQVATQVAGNIMSVGSSMDRAHVPGRVFTLTGSEENIPPGEIEIGMGIHNEPGNERVKSKLPELVKTMLAQMLDPHDDDRHFVDIASTDKVVLLINNLGGVSMLELGGITAEVCAQLHDDYDLTPARVISGTFLTSLNGLGWSATLLKLVDTGLGLSKSMLELLDLPAEAVGWAAPIARATWEEQDLAVHKYAASDSVALDIVNAKASSLEIDSKQAHVVLKAGLAKLIAAEPDVTRYDTILGDGDCGIGLKRGAEAVLESLSSPSDVPTDAVALVNRIIPIVESTMDGTSGAIYAIFLNALAYGLREQDTGQPSKVDVMIWANALGVSLEALRKYTSAAPGDRTLMDSLVPFVETLASTMDIGAAAQASRKGAETTKTMKASLGRAVYVGGENEWMGKIPDPGAWGLAEFLDGVAEAIEISSARDT